MSYEEWLNDIEILKKTDDSKIKDKMLNEPANTNIKEFLEPKLIELINFKFKTLTQKVLYNLSEMYSDQNILDMTLVNLKKGLKFIMDLTTIKTISEDSQQKLREVLNDEIKQIYDVLIDGANSIDQVGLLGLTIKNNMYKWSDKNEL